MELTSYAHIEGLNELYTWTKYRPTRQQHYK